MANLFSGVKDPLIQGTGSITDYQTSAGERFASELEGAFDTNPLAQGARMARYAIEANAPFFGLESNMVSPEVAREELKSRGLEGHITVPEGGMSRVEFDSIQYLKQRELSRQAKSAMNQSTFAHIAGFAGGLVGSAVDPINIASAFVPIVPEARIASMLGKAGSSVLGRAAVRAQVGATEGVVGALMIEPFTYAMSQYEQMDYTPADSFMNVVFGGLLGGGLHMAGGAVYDWRATRALNSLQRGLDGMNLRDMAPDLQDEVQLDILRRFTEAEENGAPLPDADEIIAQRMTPDQRSAVQEADGMPGEVPTPTRADGQPSQPKGLDELIPEAKADRTAETFNRQFLDKEQGDVAGFSDVRPPREDIFEVAQANFVGRTQHTAKTVPIDQLSGGVSADPAEAKRVSNLVDLMSGPNGYLERLIVDTDGNVIEGQHRLEALRKMGVKEVPVIEIRELREGLPVDRMMDAMQEVRGLHRDQARQIIDQIAEAIADVGSVAEVRAQYAPPRGFERAWEAALNAAETADDLKAQSDVAGAPIEGVTPEERARNLRRFMGGLPHVKDGADYQGGGAVFDAWHGTTHDITKFKKTGQIDNFLGLGPYFTTSRKDADANYAGEGPDLTLRISREEENVADSFHNDDYAAKEMLRDYLESIDSEKDVDDYDLDFLKDQYADKAIAFAARRAAKGENDGFLMKMYVKLENPADATGKSAPLTYEAKFDDNDDFVGESGTLLKWIEATREVADEFHAGPDAERYITALMEEGGDVDFKTVFDKTADFFDQVYDPDTGNSLGTGAMFREIAERAGYDGVIMDADRHFGSGRRGFGGSSVPSMEGVYPGTLHIVPFKPGNVKSAWGNRGTFDPELADIRAQSDIVDDAAGPNNGLTPYTQTLGGQTDVNQTQSPDVLGTQETGLRLLTGVRRSPGILPPSPAWSDTAPLAFLPTTVKVPGVGTIEAGAFPLARKTARDYVESTGRAYDPITTYRKVDPARAGRIAEAFEQMRHEPDNPEVKAAYEAMVKETLAQWEAVKRTGLVVEFIDISKGDPYAASPRLATEDVRNNNHLWVFATDDGFGTDGITAKDESDNPLFQIVPGEKISGKQVRANDIFRIVHDYFGHIKDGVGFRADGEENAWRSHSRMYSPLAARAMTTETRGQNSWLNYGPYGEKNRTALTQDTIFAEQKIGLLPDWVLWEGLDDLPIPVPDDRTLADELGFGDLKMMGEPLDPADGPDAPKVIGTDAAGRPVLDFRNSVVSHFTDQESADNINEFGYRVVGDGYYGEAISFTPDRSFGAQFGGVETTARISPDARILNTGVPEDAQMIQSVLNNRRLVPNNPRPGMRSWRQEFLRLGIDGVYDPGAGDLFIYNERVVRPTAMDGLDDIRAQSDVDDRGGKASKFKYVMLDNKDQVTGPAFDTLEEAQAYAATQPFTKWGHKVISRAEDLGDKYALRESWMLAGKDHPHHLKDRPDEWQRSNSGGTRRRRKPEDHTKAGEADPADIRAQSDVDESGVVMDEDGGIEVWHASPHDFDRFDLSKIGTGEGNQSYSHGLYFAESEEVSGVGGDYYKNFTNLVRERMGIVVEARYAEDALAQNKGDVQAAIADLKSQIERPVGDLTGATPEFIADLRRLEKWQRGALALLESGKPIPRAKVYKSRLRVRNDQLLDWDRPLSEQPHILEKIINEPRFQSSQAMLSTGERLVTISKQLGIHPLVAIKVQGEMRNGANLDDALSKVRSLSETKADSSPEVQQRNEKWTNDVDILRQALADQAVSLKPHIPGEWTGATIAKNVPGMKPEEIAKTLLSLGIKGVKYLDGNSRNMKDWLVRHPKGGINTFPTEAQARKYLEKNEGTLIEPKITSNYVIFDDEVIDIIDKFQSDLDEQPDLVAAHNLTAANLLHADKMGGIAAPSLAIAKASDGHEGYGEITLIGSKDLVDPQKGANVYAGDIYSARYPTVHYNIKYDAIRKLEKKFAASAKEMGVTVRESLDDDALEREGPRALENSVGAMLTYAKEKGISVEGYVFDHDAWEVRNRAAQAKEQAIREEWRAKTEAERERAQAEGRDPDETAIDDEFQPKYMEARRKAISILREPDHALDEVKWKLRNKFRGDDQFLEWAADKFAELKAKERIFKGFSNTTGAKMYTAHTLDNVVKLMTKKIRDAEGFNYGIGNLRAKVAPKFRSVEAIRGRKGSLVKREEFDAIKKEADAELMSIADQLLPKLKYKGNSFGQLDALTQHMAEAIDRNNVKRVFQEYYNGITDDDVRMVGNFLQKLKTMPTTYFEAKLDRAVQIGEFEAAIVPNTLSKKAREVLERSGVKQIIEYDPSVDGARQAAIDSIRDMKFQRDVVDVNAKSQFSAGNYTYINMDTERRQRSEALRDAIEDLIDKYTGGRAKKRWYSSIRQKAGGKIHKVDGGFSELHGLIIMALDAADHVGSVKHEALHFLKARGLISDVEWDTLVRTALREGWMDKKYGGSKLTVRQRYAHLPNMLDILEEAIAEQFRAGRYDNFQGFPPAVRAILNKLRKFFDGVAKEARKIFGQDATAEDIFRAIESGEIGRRADVEKGKVETAAILDAPQRSAPQRMKNQSTPEEDPLRVDRWAADDIAIAAEATDDSKRKDETLQDIEADSAILGAHLESMRQRGLLSQEDEADLLASNDTARVMEEQAAAYEAAGICEGEE